MPAEIGVVLVPATDWDPAVVPAQTGVAHWCALAAGTHKTHRIRIQQEQQPHTCRKTCSVDFEPLPEPEVVATDWDRVEPEVAAEIGVVRVPATD